MSDNQRDSSFFNPGDLTVPAPAKAVVNITSTEQFDAALKAAKGAVLVDFVAKDCGHCDDAKPHVDKLAQGCDVTVLRVDIDDVEALADKFDVMGTPTTLFAKSGAEMVPGKVEEVDPEDEKLKKRFKCARTPKGGAK